MAKRSKINNRDAKYELLRQSEHRDDSGQISNKATSQLYLDNYYEKNDDDSYSLNSATQRSIQASHDRTQRAANAQARKATYNTKSVNSVSRNLVDDVGKRYGYTRPTPTQQTSTSHAQYGAKDRKHAEYSLTVARRLRFEAWKQYRGTGYASSCCHDGLRKQGN